MYRPTVRYDDSYKDYVNELFKATKLDRNQIIRLAMFCAPFNRLFLAQIEQHLKDDVPLPSPVWEAFEHGYWQESEYKSEREGDDVNVYNRGTTAIKKVVGEVRSGTAERKEINRRQQQETGQERTIYSGNGERHTFRNAGGITIKL